MSSKQERVVKAGQLQLRLEQYGETCAIALVGEMDLANADALDRELQDALANGAGRIVVDLGELTFIDSTGIALLVSAVGSNGQGERVRFLRPRAAAVTRVLELTGVADRLPFADASPEGEARGSVPA